MALLKCSKNSYINGDFLYYVFLRGLIKIGLNKIEYLIYRNYV